MSELKIGEKVKIKGADEFLGYVSHVFKGHLLLLDDFEVSVHLDGTRFNVNASELEVFTDG